MNITLFGKKIKYIKKTNEGVQEILDVLKPKIIATATSYSDNLEMADKIQDINLFIIQNMKKYKPTRGAFSTFIFTYLKNFRFAQIAKSVKKLDKEAYNKSVEGVVPFKDDTLLWTLEQLLTPFDYNILYDYSVNELTLDEMQKKYFPDLSMSTARLRIKGILNNAKEKFKNQEDE